MNTKKFVGIIIYTSLYMNVVYYWINRAVKVIFRQVLTRKLDSRNLDRNISHKEQRKEPVEQQKSNRARVIVDKLSSICDTARQTLINACLSKVILRISMGLCL